MYSSFDYDGLQEEFKGCDRLTALYGNGLPKLRLRRVQKSPKPGPCIGTYVQTEPTLLFHRWMEGWIDGWMDRNHLRLILFSCLLAVRHFLT